ncbi:MAG: hypothetical protein KGL39_56105 [Patescibacteria group bacterium]|nr:hypothetical protein [Patescibacteria group bacterium]
MKKVFWIALAAFVLTQTACSIWPSNWRLFGTPLDKEKRAAAKVEQTTADLDHAAQRAVHQTTIALDAAKTDAPESKALAVARDFNAEAQALLDQAHGAPAIADQDAWRRLVADVLAGRDQERKAQAAEVAALSGTLAKERAAHERTLTKVAEYAQENAGLADWVRKLAWFAIAVGVFIVGTHLLGLAAHLNPTSALLGGLATGAQSVLASGAVLAQRRANDALQRIGSGIALIRQKLPDAASAVTTYFDAVTASHPEAQAHIAAGAAAAGAPPS